MSMKASGRAEICKDWVY